MTRADDPTDEFNSFDPEAIETMHQAYRQACIALQIFAGDERGKRMIAARVVDLAKTGVIDARALRDRILFEGRLAA